MFFFLSNCPMFLKFRWEFSDFAALFPGRPGVVGCWANLRCLWLKGFLKWPNDMPPYATISMWILCPWSHPKPGTRDKACCCTLCWSGFDVPSAVATRCLYLQQFDQCMWKDPRLQHGKRCHLVLPKPKGINGGAGEKRMLINFYTTFDIFDRNRMK